jgi:hypothetical protein
MADKKISALTAATLPLDGTEVLPIVQSGTTVKVTNNSLRPTQLQSNATSGVLQVAGPAASTTRVMTVPNANFTAARTDAAQSFTGAQSFGNNINLTDSTAAKVNFATVSSATTNYIQTHSDGYSLMLYVDRGVSKPSYLMNFGGTHEWGFAGTSSLELDVTNKDLTIKTGNLIQGTAAKGVNFTANTPAAGMTSQLLNWYEEGTYTPTIASVTGTITSYTASGRYTRIGRLVTLTATVTITNNGTGATGLWLENFPFTAGADSGGVTGREGAVTGKGVIGSVNSGATRAFTVFYDGTYPGGTNYTIAYCVTYTV